MGSAFLITRTGLKSFRLFAALIRTVPYSSLLNNEHREAYKILNSNKNLMIRRADKSNTYFLLSYDDYERKLNMLLEYETQIEKIRTKIVERFQTKINYIVDSFNAAYDHIHLEQLNGHIIPPISTGTRAKTQINRENLTLRTILS